MQSLFLPAGPCPSSLELISSSRFKLAARFFFSRRTGPIGAATAMAAVGAGGGGGGGMSRGTLAGSSAKGWDEGNMT